MNNRRTGLTLGKFAPLHKGHQLLIETALRETDEVLVLIYNCPGISDIPLNVRAKWIRDIYPSVEVIEAWDGPCEVGDTVEIKRMHEDYILRILAGRRITHFYSSEFYGDHVSRALGAYNRLVDPNRDDFPISGTDIRCNPYLYRQFIHPRVYRDLVTNVVFLGAPSTGKTTIAEQLAKIYDTQWMPEYGREYWDAHQIDRRLSTEQLSEIAKGHVELEEAFLYNANRFLFTDTNALTTYIFSFYYHGRADKSLIDLANAAHARYDLVFVCDTDIPYDDTWDRSGEGNRQEFHQRIISDLAERKIPYLLLRGTLDARINYVKQVLGRFHKSGNLVNLFSCMPLLDNQVT